MGGTGRSEAAHHAAAEVTGSSDRSPTGERQPPRIGLGCVALASASSDLGWRASVRLVQDAVDEGVTLFDTADAYGSGNSERLLGEALRDRRDDVTVATKVGYLFDERGRWEQTGRRAARRAMGVADLVRRQRASAPGAGTRSGGGAYDVQDFSRQHLERALDASLRRLRTDRVDVYQLHGPPEVRDDVIDVLRGFVDAGKVLRIGLGAESVGSAAAWVAGDDRDSGLDVVQVPFGPLDPEAATDVLPACRDRGVAVWARGVLGGGLLAAAVRGDDGLRNDPKWPMIEGLRTIADDLDTDVLSLAVGFVAAHQVDAVLLGTSSAAHLRQNVHRLRDAAPLPADVVARLGALGCEGDAN